MRVKKTIKQLKVDMYGDEPTLVEATPDTYEASLRKALNWYHATEDSQKAKDHYLAYLDHIDAAEDVIDAATKRKYTHFATYGYIARMFVTGAKLDPKTIENLEQFTRSMVSDSQKKTDENSDSDIVQVTVRDRTEARANALIGEIEETIIDKVIATKTFKPDNFYGWLQAHEVKGIHAKIIADRFDAMLSEYRLAQKSKDEQIIEGYSNFTPKQLGHMVSVLTGIIADARKIQLNAKAARKPRKTRTINVTKVLAKVKYKKTDDELKISSVDIAKVIGAEEVYTFNTKYRKLSVFKAASADGLKLKGTTILNFDEATSMQKRLRKPKQQIDEMMTAGKVALRKFMTNIRAVAAVPKGRLNEDTLILKVVK